MESSARRPGSTERNRSSCLLFLSPTFRGSVIEDVDAIGPDRCLFGTRREHDGLEAVRHEPAACRTIAYLHLTNSAFGSLFSVRIGSIQKRTFEIEVAVDRAGRSPDRDSSDRVAPDFLVGLGQLRNGDPDLGVATRERVHPPAQYAGDGKIHQYAVCFANMTHTSLAVQTKLTRTSTLQTLLASRYALHDCSGFLRLW